MIAGYVRFTQLQKLHIEILFSYLSKFDENPPLTMWVDTLQTLTCLSHLTVRIGSQVAMDKMVEAVPVTVTHLTLVSTRSIHPLVCTNTALQHLCCLRKLTLANIEFDAASSVCVMKHSHHAFLTPALFPFIFHVYPTLDDFYRENIARSFSTPTVINVRFDNPLHLEVLSVSVVGSLSKMVTSLSSLGIAVLASRHFYKK